jgi:hypothetical protein
VKPVWSWCTTIDRLTLTGAERRALERFTETDPDQFIPEVAALAGAMFKATRNGSIPQTTIGLAQLRAEQIVGNTCHTVRQTGDLRGAGGGHPHPQPDRRARPRT